ncbi:MAG: ATP-binding cassette domain-containing protein [Nitrososphaerales archaeon]|nr:ATP-binding cassette domain-containing protein [Nitrososphaerales archaeon]
MTDSIVVKDLFEVYPDGTKAVNGISFNVEEGQFFGFLGPNGAGKSTTIKVLTTLLKKTSGSVNVAGLDLDKHSSEIRKMIGVQSQETVVDHDLTGRENLVLAGNLQGMKGEGLKGKVDSLLDLMQLKEVADKRAGRYSGGMKKRLDLASTLVHEPKLLFLDEPTTGLDPQSRAGIWEYLEKLNRDEHITIFLTTQYMDEADRLCKNMAIVDSGKIVASGSPVDLKRQVGADTITVQVAPDMKEKAKDILKGIRSIREVIDSDGGMTAYAQEAGSIIADIVRAFDEKNVVLKSINFAQPTLDDVFLEHTGKRIRPEELLKQSTGGWRMRR